MKKPILIVLCCASLMLIIPFTTVAQENQVSNNLPEQPNDVEGLIVQIRTVVDEILEKYSHIPIIAKQCGIILNLLELVGFLIICIFSIMLFIPLFTLGSVFQLLDLEDLQIFFASYALLFLLIMVKYCGEFISRLLFPSLYSMLNVNFNTQSFDGCPCLQE